MAPFSPQAVFVALGANDKNQQGACRAMFRASLDPAAIDDIRLPLNQNQPLGNTRFMTKIARVTGERLKSDHADGHVKTLRLLGARLAVSARRMKFDTYPLH